MMMRTKKQLMVVMLSFALLIGMIPSMEVSAAKKVSLSAKKLIVTTGKSKTLKVKNTQKKVKWKILSGKKFITLKKKGKMAVTIKGKKKGTAKVQAVIGKKKLDCKVIVKDAQNDNTTKSDAPKKPMPSANTQSVASTTPPINTQMPSANPIAPPTDTQVPLPTASPTNTPEEVNEQDVVVLKNLIAEQRERGAIVSENINNSDEYTWENGRLVEIEWRSKSLTGDLNLTGLSALQSLGCMDNEITDLNLTELPVLQSLDCMDNKLKDLNISNNFALEKIWCQDNELSKLDASNCEKLQWLFCFRNSLNSLDVSNCICLTMLECGSNKLSVLDVSQNTMLEQLTCGNNQLTALDVTKNIALWLLNCSNNQLTTLDVTKNTALKYLYCSNNQLTTLDITKNTKLDMDDSECDANVTIIMNNN